LHAPDVTCPIWFGYGIDDTLAQPQGIEAMYHFCASKWKRIICPPGSSYHVLGFGDADLLQPDTLGVGHDAQLRHLALVKRCPAIDPLPLIQIRAKGQRLGRSFGRSRQGSDLGVVEPIVVSSQLVE
jgi:hypothetical protein